MGQKRFQPEIQRFGPGAALEAKSYRRSVWWGWGIGLLFCGAIAALLFSYIVYNTSEQPEALPFSSLGVLGAILLGLLAAIAVGQFHAWLAIRLPWQSYAPIRLALGFSIDGVLALLVLLLPCLWYAHTFFPGDDWEYFMQSYRDSLIKVSVLVLFMCLIYNIIDLSLHAYRQYAVVQVRAEALKQQQLTLQYQLLRTQLSPHYLFNNLNTLSALAYKDPSLADNYIRHFSSTFRYILATHDRELVPLEEELRFLEAYLFLLKTRFDKRLRTEIDLPASEGTYVIPPLTLQLLVENAVKHNVASAQQVLHLNISLDPKGYLAVSNNKTQAPKQQAESTGLGLNNIRQRFAYHTAKPIEIIEDDTFTVKLPLLTSTSHA